MRTWRIQAEHSGLRLDLFLSAQQAESSRSAVQKAVKQGLVTVNGRPVRVHYFLKLGDEVVWHELIPSSISALTLETLLPPLEVVAETEDWLVVNKPAGLLVHPDTKTKQGTLVDLLLAHDPRIGRVGPEPERPGIVHRLDREVSGLMLVAKKEAAYEALKKQFGQRKIKKYYVALVHGEVLKNEGEIKFRIARSTSKGRMAARPEHEEEGRAAWTHYRVRERFTGATLLELEIFSGRTHQIRAHLHALGHPVFGDPLYTKRQPDRKQKAPRLMLQSVGLEFTDPTTHELRTYSLALDQAFDELKKQLRPQRVKRKV